MKLPSENNCIPQCEFVWHTDIRHKENTLTDEKGV